MTLINNYSIMQQLEQTVTQSVVNDLQKFLPASIHEVVIILKYYNIRFRMDFSRGGQDCDTARVNIKTDGNGTVKSLSIG